MEGTHAAAAMTCFFLKQPTFLWVELFVAVAYVSKRAPQSPIAVETPYKNIYRKNADISCLRVHLQVAVRGVDRQRNAANAKLTCSISMSNTETRRLVVHSDVCFMVHFPVQHFILVGISLHQGVKCVLTLPPSASGARLPCTLQNKTPR